MKRLRELRGGLGYTQEQLAKMLNTTQQTVARWETGKAEPSLQALRDLAMIFGTSADELLGSRNPLSEEVTTTWHTLFVDKESDGYWGHVGLQMPGKKRGKWYPISQGAANAVGMNLGAFESGDAWLVIPTLANRMLAANPTNLKSIKLMDEAHAEPKTAPEMFPLEFYKALDDYFTDNNKFRESASPTLLSIVEDEITRRGLDEQTALEFTHYSTLYFMDGSRRRYWIDENDLWSLVLLIDMEQVPPIINLDDSGGGVSHFYPRDKIALIDMPLLQVKDAAEKQAAQDKRLLEDLEQAGAARAASARAPHVRTSKSGGTSPSREPSK